MLLLDNLKLRDVEKSFMSSNMPTPSSAPNKGVCVEVVLCEISV